MLFESLDKIRRGTLLSAILLIALGIIIMICPVSYIDSLILAFGYADITISNRLTISSLVMSILPFVSIL